MEHFAEEQLREKGIRRGLFCALIRIHPQQDPPVYAVQPASVWLLKAGAGSFACLHKIRAADLQELTAVDRLHIHARLFILLHPRRQIVCKRLHRHFLQKPLHVFFLHADFFEEAASLQIALQSLQYKLSCYGVLIHRTFLEFFFLLLCFNTL